MALLEVWIATACIDYESSNIIGVAKSEDLAKVMIEDFKKAQLNKFGYLTYDSYETERFEMKV